jgi:hypothetical protein
MFKVENADFIADKLAAELLPLQEYREAFKNALEAVERRMRADGSATGGRIEFDVDWALRSTGHWYVSCADNGDGMSRYDLERYMTTLAVEGASGNQSIRGNQGMGLKISGPTRHKNGVIIRSLKNGERTMVQIGWDADLGEYGLIPIGQNDELVVSSVSERFYPDFINEQGSGTVVSFLGSDPDANTVVPPGEAKGWLLKYLNQRFFRLSDERIKVVVRVPSGDPDEWPSSREEADKRRPGSRQFNMTKIDGTARLWDEASEAQGQGFHGSVNLPGDIGAPQAEMHWWVLPASGIDVSSRTASGGSFAILYDNELHDWKKGNQANAFFARLGVLYGKSRIAFILEPRGDTIASDFARAHVLVSGTPVFESDAWLRWAEQFRAAVPERIRETMAEEQARLEVEDPERVKRIRDRLREVMQLLRPRRFRRVQQGGTPAKTEVLGAGSGRGVVQERPISPYQTKTRRSRGRGIGAALSELDPESVTSGQETSSTTDLVPQWITEDQAESITIVNGNGNGIRDRAAALAGEDGRTAGVLLLNRDFRGYQSMLAAMNDWANPEGDEDKMQLIEGFTQEWVEQKMLEAVQGLRQLENGRTWITEHYDAAFSPVSLTAAFMADRYHTLREVRRAVGSLRHAGPSR